MLFRVAILEVERMRIALAIRLGNGAPSFRSLSSPWIAASIGKQLVVSHNQFDESEPASVSGTRLDSAPRAKTRFHPYRCEQPTVENLDHTFFLIFEKGAIRYRARQSLDQHPAIILLLQRASLVCRCTRNTRRSSPSSLSSVCPAAVPITEARPGILSQQCAGNRCSSFLIVFVGTASVLARLLLSNYCGLSFYRESRDDG